MHDSVLCPRADQPRRKLEIGEIQVELYRRECRKLNVTPVGAFIRSPSSPVLNIRHYSLGPGGALALSVPLTVSSEICDTPPPPTPHPQSHGEFVNMCGYGAVRFPHGEKVHSYCCCCVA